MIAMSLSGLETKVVQQCKYYKKPLFRQAFKMITKGCIEIEQAYVKRGKCDLKGPIETFLLWCTVSDLYFGEEVMYYNSELETAILTIYSMVDSFINMASTPKEYYNGLLKVFTGCIDFKDACEHQAWKEQCNREKEEK